MTDIALVLLPDGTGADIAIVNGDILLDDGLDTAVLWSLLPWRKADPGDPVPEGIGPGGWWGDAFLPPLPDGTPDYYGSKLYQYTNCAATQESANGIMAAISQALNWMLLDNVAAAINVTGIWQSAVSFATNIEIDWNAPGGAVVPKVYNYLWNTTLGLLPAPSSAPLGST